MRAARLNPVLFLSLFAVPGAAGQGLSLFGPAEVNKPFTVTGEWGAILGEQSGIFEAWSFPVKLLRDVRLEARLDDYPIPIDVNAQAAHIDTTPLATTITYAHAAFTIRQRMIAPRTGAFAPPLVFFEIDSIRPLTLTLRFTPEMQRMWPAPVFGRPNASWDDGLGFYILYTDNPGLAGAVWLPGAKPGILPPYQERPKSYPAELLLRFDPRRDTGRRYPLVAVAGNSREDAIAKIRAADPEAAARETESYYRNLLGRLAAVETPDARFNDAFQWAVASLDQMRVRHGSESGLAAGFYTSGDSARPGFGWFFGRDTLWSLYAIHAAGSFTASREALDFLIRRQRADGKIMHEYSQSAPFVDWPSLPYFYASADATPLLPMALDDYLRASGDLDFVRTNWNAARKAYAFVRAHDSNGDGVYENTEGHGWVESWPPKMPFQEMYLAALDQQMCLSMASLAAHLNDTAMERGAAARADRIAKQIAAYRDPATGLYRFSRNRDGSYDATATIFPSVAWWTGRHPPEDGEATLRDWASAAFSTDWGARAVADRERIYDPISYHQGSVWPLFTGWLAMAEYRAGRPAAGWQHLKQNAELTYAQDPGAITELLSGAYFEPLGRSSSRQMWSSAMVVAPAVKGLFGLDPDVPHHRLRAMPQLPASWDRAVLHRFPFGTTALEVAVSREGDHLRVGVTSGAALALCINGADKECRAQPAREWQFTVPLPRVEVEALDGLPTPGSRTHQVKILDVAGDQVTLEGPAGTESEIYWRAAGAGRRVRVAFPAGSGYQRITLRNP